MKKLILLALFVPVFYSFNKDNKTAVDKTSNHSKQAILSAPKQSDTLNIDIVKTSPNQAKVLMENQYVRVVEYFIKPGEKDVWHTHPPRSSYVVSGGKVKVYSENGEPKISEVITGTSSWAGQGAKHYVENIGNTDIKIILTEIKGLQ
jgi:quercetin dioxygenase-like cupin family protein